jgi:RimJ/RimL family protein N-acetyltransferase
MGRFRGVELADLELAGPRLELRRWRPADAPAVHAVMQDRRMHEFLALPDPYTLDDAWRFVAELGHEGRDDGTGLGCAVSERATGRLVGAAALRLGTDPEIGYWVAPAAQGRGYAAEVSRVLAEWAFTVGLRRVALACAVRNVASIRTALAAGFAFEGVSRGGLLGGGRGPVPELRADLARFARLAGDPGEPIGYAFPPLPAEGLCDGVLRLRTLLPGDADAVLETEDELTVGWSFSGQPMSPAEARQSTEQAWLHWLAGGVARFAIVDVASDRLAGTLSLRRAGPPQVGGIGYVVHPVFRGRGYTARALRLLASWAFEVAGYARLELGAKIGNIASQRAALAAGFEPDGTRRARLRNPDGTFCDEARFALVNPRYR